MKKPIFSSAILVTGGAGFMGSDFIRSLLEHPAFLGKIINVDALTYAGNRNYFEESPHYFFVHGNILNTKQLEELCSEHEVDYIVHFAAETHVDRSIHDPEIFFQTNVMGTLSLLQTVRKFPQIHFHHISTDEVYGTLSEEDKALEESAYFPNSPYAASKAASDHLVRSFISTYGISATISHASNNYGPRQYPEKLIPLTIRSLLKKMPIPLYGDGMQTREWLFVEDHSRAILAILSEGKSGHVYNVGSGIYMKNRDVVSLIAKEFADFIEEDRDTYLKLMTFTLDRPGHDRSYAMDTSKIQMETGWIPRVDFNVGIKKTLQWYLDAKNHLHYSSKA